MTYEALSYLCFGSAAGAALVLIVWHTAERVGKMTEETSGIRAVLGEILDALEDMICSHCATDLGDERFEVEAPIAPLTSHVIRLLVRFGRVKEVDDENGRHVYSRPKKRAL